MTSNNDVPPPDERLLTALHEAGHAVAYCHFGMKIQSVTCVPDQDSLGAVAMESAVIKSRFRMVRQMEAGQPVSPAARAQVENRIIATLAGGIAETKGRGYRNNESAGADYETCVDLAVRLCGGDSNEANYYLAWLECRAQKLVASRWKEIAVVANSLQDQGTLSGADVECLLQKFHESQQR